jgi:hypothetical protein
MVGQDGMTIADRAGARSSAYRSARASPRRSGPTSRRWPRAAWSVSSETMTELCGTVRGSQDAVAGSLHRDLGKAP